MGRQRPPSQASRRKAAARELPIPALDDPCSCRNQCPTCLTKCMGGHAMYPHWHLCYGEGDAGKSHSWKEPRE